MSSDLVLPPDLWRCIYSLRVMLLLYEQWCTIVAELRAQWRHEIRGWPHRRPPWTANESKSPISMCHWVASIERLYWHGNRIVALQYGHNASCVLTRMAMDSQDSTQICCREIRRNEYRRVYILSDVNDTDCEHRRASRVLYCQKLMCIYGGPIALLTIEEAKLKARRVTDISAHI